MIKNIKKEKFTTIKDNKLSGLFNCGYLQYFRNEMDHRENGWSSNTITSIYYEICGFEVKKFDANRF